jgi:pyrroloquinoline quinone biosynthesis protein B
VRIRAAILAVLSTLVGCRSPQASTPPNTPYVLVLGTAQDGGQPQIGCDCERCEAARAEPESRRLVTSLLLADPVNKKRYLFDASPDLIAQVASAEGHPATRIQPPGRAPLFEGIFVTHAHMGHYSGLLQLGREAYGATAQKLYGTARFAAFLGGNAPWDQMLERGTFDLGILQPGVPLELAGELTVTALLVPHRDEYSDTVGFLIRSPRAALFYVPDIDKWERWTATRIEDVIASVDYAVLDGTFFQAGEIPGRAMDEIPHPFIAESMARFATLPATERAKIYFTHFNHTNPVSNESSPEAAAVRAAGFHLAREGKRFVL